MRFFYCLHKCWCFYKSNISFLTQHAIDPDKRRYAVEGEGPRHFIDLDTYGAYPFPNLPRDRERAIEKFGEDINQCKRDRSVACANYVR